MSDWKPSMISSEGLSNIKRRWSPPRKPGQLKAGFARFEGCFDFIVGSDHKCDNNLIHNMIATTTSRYDVISRTFKQEKCLLQELEDRGYDLSTLRFSIEKKKEQQDDD